MLLAGVTIQKLFQLQTFVLDDNFVIGLALDYLFYQSISEKTFFHLNYGGKEVLLLPALLYSRFLLKNLVSDYHYYWVNTLLQKNRQKI